MRYTSILFLFFTFITNALLTTSIFGPTFPAIAYIDFEREKAAKTSYFVNMFPCSCLSYFFSLNLTNQYSNKKFSNNPDDFIESYYYKKNCVDLIQKIDLYLLDYMSLGFGLNDVIQVSKFIKRDDNLVIREDNHLLKTGYNRFSAKVHAQLNYLRTCILYNFKLTIISSVAFPKTIIKMLR